MKHINSNGARDPSGIVGGTLLNRRYNDKV